MISDTRCLNHLTLMLLDKFGHDIHFFRDPTRSGIAGTLNEIASGMNLGITYYYGLVDIMKDSDLPQYNTTTYNSTFYIYFTRQFSNVSK